MPIIAWNSFTYFNEHSTFFFIIIINIVYKISYLFIYFKIKKKEKKEKRMCINRKQLSACESRRFLRHLLTTA